MKRIFILAVLLLIARMSLLARRVPLEQAQGYARNWWLQKDGPRSAVLEPVETEFDNIYLFVSTDGHGFVMLSADDRSLPVLCYSLSNGFAVEGMPESVHEWVRDYNDQIQWLIDNNIEKTSEVNEQWKDLRNEQRTLADVYPTSVDSLVLSKWNQNVPYNYFCPSVTWKTNAGADTVSKALTGCVATSMAQILHYHRHPSHGGTGTHSYTCSTTGTTESADFANTVYDWANMIPIYYTYKNGTPYNYDTVQRNAIATLMHHVGVAVEMKYGATGSSAYAAKTTYLQNASAEEAYRKYFKYKWTTTSVYMADYSDADWKLLLKNEIDNSRPIQYSGWDVSGGHSFVCDGYSTDGRFNFNWGWGGRYNGKYAIGDLHPGTGGAGGNSTYTFNLRNNAIIGIEPDSSASGTVIITPVSNDETLGTVSGGGTYTRFQQTVTMTPSAKVGCRFVNWSNNSTEVPLSFTASGDNSTIVANFERVEGDTLYYCKNSFYVSFRLVNDGSLNRWGIKIPSRCLTAGKCLSNVMFYCNSPGDYTVKIYEKNFGETDGTLLYSEAYKVTQNGEWVSLPLSAILPVNSSFDLCIVLESAEKYPCAISTSAANDDGAYGFDGSAWRSYSSANSSLTWMIKAVMSSPHNVTMDASKAQLTSVSNNVDLREIEGLCVSNKESSVRYEMVSCSPQGIASVTDSRLTATGVGTVTIRAIATPTDTRFADAAGTVDLTIGKGTLVFENSQNDGKWTNPANWGPHYSLLPDATNFDVRVDVACEVPTGAKAQCHDLSFGTKGSLTVESGGMLDVKGELNNDDADRLLIKADSTGSGSVFFDTGTPLATVEMYTKGTSTSDGSDGYLDPQWQLRGSIVDDFALKNPSDWADIHVYEWIESNNASGCWSSSKMVGSNIALEPWKGYGFANYSTTPATVGYTGILLNKDQSWALTRTGSGNANVGANMLTNSYSAPIEIAQMLFSNAQSCVIFYNTGSLLEWQKYKGDLSDSGDNPGQYLVCPVMTSQAAGMPTAISSGQSFYVVAEQNGASVSVDYQGVLTQKNDPMFAPAEQQEQFNVLGVIVSGVSGADRVVLIECDNCDDHYNDGYDGMKYPGRAGIPQLFVVNDFGKTSINASKTILGQKIGVSSVEAGTTLKMSFETDRLSGFAQLTVEDLRTGKFVNVSGGEEYEFVATGNDGARFEIVGLRTRSDDENEEGMKVYGNRLFTGRCAGVTVMCDMSGKTVWQTDVRENEWVDLPEVMHGVYVVKNGNCSIKIVK